MPHALVNALAFLFLLAGSLFAAAGGFAAAHALTGLAVILLALGIALVLVGALYAQRSMQLTLARAIRQPEVREPQTPETTDA